MSRFFRRSDRVVEPQHIAARQQNGPFDDVLQFSNVSGPGVRLQRFDRPRSESESTPAVALRGLLEEMCREARKVFGSLAERWQHNRKHAEAIEQVAAETTGGNFLSKVPVGRGYHSDVDSSCCFVADALESTFLQHTEQLSL